MELRGTNASCPQRPDAAMARFVRRTGARKNTGGRSGAAGGGAASGGGLEGDGSLDGAEGELNEDCVHYCQPGPVDEWVVSEGVAWG